MPMVAMTSNTTCNTSPLICTFAIRRAFQRAIRPQAIAAAASVQTVVMTTERESHVELGRAGMDCSSEGVAAA